MAKILVMDDDEVIRELLKLHLSGAGYDVLVAEDGVAGGLVLQKERPDLVLVDIDMPYFDGLQLLKAMKGDPSVERIPVIFITSKTDAEAQAKRFGAVAYFAKPLRIDSLLATVAKHLPA
jgi:two-component system, chemotaxis family, chemotaxis protein CheY